LGWVEKENIIQRKKNNKLIEMLSCVIIGKMLKRYGKEISKNIMKKLTTNEFIEKANKIHDKFYDYSKFIYTKSNIKGIITCKKHGEFKQSPNSHLRRTGCPICGFEKSFASCRNNKNDFINEAKNIHGNKYDYSNVDYKRNNKIKVEIICKTHGPFFQNPNNHIALKQGCPKCIHIISKPEIEFLDYLNLPNIQSHRQVKILRKKVDGFDPKTNTIYEFLGNYYHGNPNMFNLSDYNQTCHKTFGELYENTMKVFTKLKSIGYNIKYIWELDWNRFKKKETNIPTILSF